MKALTIKPSWAWAIMYGGKDIENRSWKTNLRGRIAIHSSVGLTKKSYEADKIAIMVRRFKNEPPFPKYEDLVKGYILGTAELVDCVTYSTSRWMEGDYGFVLQNPQPLEIPIPCSGRLGFWDIPVNLNL